MPQIFARWKSLLLYAIGIPVFYLAFCMLYRPAVLNEFFVMDGILTFNRTILMCIVLGVMVLSRVAQHYLWRWMHMTWLRYISWIAGELAVMAMFMALYMVLMYRGEFGYFYCVGCCLLDVLTVLVYPYVIFTVCLALSDKPLREAEQADSLVRFVDATQRLKLILAKSAILYVEAAENYVRIVYTEYGVRKDCDLRNTMKGIERLMQQHGMVRCQRSYYVNPQRVKTLTRDKDGSFLAELDMPEAKKIPVSPKFYEDLTRKL